MIANAISDKDNARIIVLGCAATQYLHPILYLENYTWYPRPCGVNIPANLPQETGIQLSTKSKEWEWESVYG
ncbi:hypothetical protein EYZ11_000608 [Aspergillus tanneri]|uniref:Uncharacterized protein n=1 Tax=Aspergillus tanneri TaxID=1220188 RepID=A0A4V3UQQ0_9EURO|nr:hypothetical protein EYZ11_000608 [Aspergillus tanneri]